MHNWFESKVRYEKVDENGVSKKVTESFLVDALSCTEAEARATEEVSPYISGGKIPTKLILASNEIELPIGCCEVKGKVAFSNK